MTEENKNNPTREEYLKAAKTLADCTRENTPYVIALLRDAGFQIPDLPTPQEQQRRRPEADLSSISSDQIKDIFEEAAHAGRKQCVTKIDGTSMLILRELRRQTGLTMMALASKLICDGAQALGLDTDS